jgi:hypothetical protein
LQYAQQFDLQRGRQLAHLVEQQTAAVGFAKQPTMALFGARESAALVTEKLALHQRFGQGPAVHHQERRRSAIRQPMDGAGHPFFARPALPRDQHGRAHWRHSLHQVHDRAQGRTATDQLALRGRLDLCPQPPIFRDQGLLFEGLVNQRCQLGWLKGLRHEVIGTQAHRLNCVLYRRMRGDQDHLGRLAARFGGRQHVQAGAIRHRQIGEHDRKRLRVLGDGFERGPQTRRQHDLIALPTKEDRQHFAQTRLVLDDQDLGSRRNERAHEPASLAHRAAENVVLFRSAPGPTGPPRPQRPHASLSASSWFPCTRVLVESCARSGCRPSA